MSSQQTQQKCQLPAKCLPKCPPKCLAQAPQAPQALAPCPAPCSPPVPSCCVHSCTTGFGNCCSLGSHRFPDVFLGPLQPSNCWERECSGCSSCCHGFGGCSF
ncbi:late cornified envelope protein 7A [Neofelis nebulosa]|uniref:late cornified envelope protein 7A n=1 Tax=Neofelis nebulosa TaxID=61452 RepID=UPI00272A6479|nr:late cornified envelope protein 7A [Neofelis nebulosa]XP_058553384.1 late cornified envelope protein 7A [Neofelis nebulosa]XP_058553394.1 late cornified envelope protein 7A [Neofelis nebulosa]